MNCGGQKSRKPNKINNGSLYCLFGAFDIDNAVVLDAVMTFLINVLPDLVCRNSFHLGRHDAHGGLVEILLRVHLDLAEEELFDLFSVRSAGLDDHLQFILDGISLEDLGAGEGLLRFLFEHGRLGELVPVIQGVRARGTDHRTDLRGFPLHGEVEFHWVFLDEHREVEEVILDELLLEECIANNRRVLHYKKQLQSSGRYAAYCCGEGRCSSSD